MKKPFHSLVFKIIWFYMEKSTFGGNVIFLLKHKEFVPIISFCQKFLKLPENTSRTQNFLVVKILQYFEVLSYFRKHKLKLVKYGRSIQKNGNCRKLYLTKD